MTPPPTPPPTLAARLPWRALPYVGLAIYSSWPALPELGRSTAGADRTDVWNALWSLHFVRSALYEGRLPWRTELLDPPAGGTLLVADPINALLAVPIGLLFDLPTTWSLLVIAHLSLLGWVAHRFAMDLAGHHALPREPAGFVAGVACATAPVVLASIHNGTSEGVPAGLVLLSAWAGWSAAVRGGAWRMVGAVLALTIGALTSAYGAVVAFLFAVGLVLLPPVGEGGRAWCRRRSALVLVLGFVLVAPVYAGIQQAATGEGNLVRIKHDRELQTVRRSTGPADLRGFVLGGEFRSPDFREISRYGEQFIHCHYLGATLLFGAALAARRRRGEGWLWAGGTGALLLSLGPVVVADGAALIIGGDRAIPLPYLLVERLPGFSSLSLLFRLSLGPALALGVLAALGAVSTRRPAGAAALFCTLILVEGRTLSPMRGLPDTVTIPPAEPLLALAQEPKGVVLNFPVVGGRAYLYEQTVHGKPMAGTLNFPNNAVGIRAWKELILASEALGPDPDEEAIQVWRERVARKARAAGVRYVVIHDDPLARPDMHDVAAEAVALALDPLGSVPEDAAVRAYRLW